MFQVKLLTWQFTPVFSWLLCFVCHLFHNFAACYIIVVEYSLIYVCMYTYIWQSNIYANVINEIYVTWVAAAWTDTMPVATRKFDRSLGQILHDQLHWLDVPDRVFSSSLQWQFTSVWTAAHHRVCRSTASRFPVLTRRHLCSTNRHLLAVPRFPLNTYGRRAFSVSGLDGLELAPGFYPGSNEQHRVFLGVNLKRTTSRVTSASSALGVLNDYALYKSTHSLTMSPGKCAQGVVIAMLHTAACVSRQPAWHCWPLVFIRPSSAPA